MRIGGAGPHLRCDPNRFHQLLVGCAFLHGGFRVSADAIGTLRDVRHGDRDQLLGFRRQCAVGKHPLAKRPKRGVDFRRQFPPFLRELL